LLAKNLHPCRQLFQRVVFFAAKFGFPSDKQFLRIPFPKRNDRATLMPANKKLTQMQQTKKLSLHEINGDLKIYFNWSANALMPIKPGAADKYLTQHRSTISNVA
jgi:hypothetical protein